MNNTPSFQDKLNHLKYKPQKYVWTSRFGVDTELGKSVVDFLYERNQGHQRCSESDAFKILLSKGLEAIKKEPQNQ